MKNIICQVSHEQHAFQFNFRLYNTNRPIDWEFSAYLPKLEYVDEFLIKISDDNMTKDYFVTLSLDVVKKLTEVGFLHANMEVNLFLTEFFYEDIYLPKIASKDAMKSLQLEMDKLYYNFDEKYISEPLYRLQKRELMHIRYLMIDKNIYTRIIYFLKRLASNITGIHFAPYALSNAFIKSHSFFERKKIADAYFICNIGVNYSVVNFMAKKELVHYEVFGVGTSDLDKALAGVIKMSKEDILTNREKGVFFNEVVPLVRTVFVDVLNAITRMLGAHSSEYSINDIYLNVESLYKQSLQKIFEKDLRMNILPFNKIQEECLNNLFDYSTLITLDKTDIHLPQKVKL